MLLMTTPKQSKWAQVCKYRLWSKTNSFDNLDRVTREICCITVTEPYRRACENFRSCNQCENLQTFSLAKLNLLQMETGFWNIDGGK